MIGENDVVFLYSTQEILKPEFLSEINKISNYPIFVCPMDMEPLTGGCHHSCEHLLDEPVRVELPQIIVSLAYPRQNNRFPSCVSDAERRTSLCVSI